MIGMLKYFLSVIILLAIMFVLWTVNQGSYDISDWSEPARNSYGIIGGFGAIIIGFIRIFF